MDLTEFLRARLDEDEAALGDEDPQWGDARGVCYECGTSHSRLLREVEAKRAILAAHPVRPVRNGTCQVCTDVEGTSYLSYLGDEHEKAPPPCPTLRALAAVYSDHPDYRAEWKP